MTKTLQNRSGHVYWDDDSPQARGLGSLLARRLFFLLAFGDQTGMCTCACAYSLTDGAVFVQHLCQVLAMSADELKEHAEKEGWSDAESDDADDGSSPLSFGLYLSLGSFCVAWMLFPRCVCFIPGVYALFQSQMCLLCTRYVCFVPVPGVFALSQSQVCLLCPRCVCFVPVQGVCFVPGMYALHQVCLLCPRHVCFVLGIYALSRACMLCPSPRCICFAPDMFAPVPDVFA